MRRGTELITALALAAAVAACGGNRTTDERAAGAPPAGTAGAGVSADARDFMTGAGGSGTAEVELGRLAQDKATSAEVRQFAEMMVRDHSKANEELKQIAEREGVQLPSAMDERHRDQHDRLARLSGAEFEREYMTIMVDNHKSSVERFERQANEGSDTELKQFAAKTLPTVRQHLERAQQIQQTLGKQGQPR
jgi:putative membrane protein